MQDKIDALRESLIAQVMEQKLGHKPSKEERLFFHTEIYREREYLLYKGFVLGELRYQLVNDGADIEYIFHPRTKTVSKTDKMIKEILIVAGDDNTSLEFKYQKIMALLQDAKYDRLSD
jgi:hypothetical protein